jgi:hypothetical protein
MEKHEFGTCCKDLAIAMESDKRTPLFRVWEDGTLFVSVGFLQTENQVGWFDMAVIYCPFFGTKLQDKEKLKSKGHMEKPKS